MLTIENLSFIVPDADHPGQQRTILEHFNYAFEPGKFYGITGPNGSGKTTLGKLIMGIHRPTSGQLIFNHQDITDTAINERSKIGIAYSFQQPARFKGITFRNLLSIAAGTDNEDHLIHLISRVGICSIDFLDKPVDARLSGGEIKKIELATTIAQNPKLAIYDEPDTGIDLWTITPMIDLLKKEQAEKNTTTLVITHNKNFLEAADVILILNKGKFVYEGNLDGALPLLTDLSTCTLQDICEEDNNVRCYR